MSLSDDKQADSIDAFKTTSRYLDGMLNINNVYFNNLVSPIYSSEFQPNKANTYDTKDSFLACICPLLMILILQKNTIHVTISIL